MGILSDMIGAHKKRAENTKLKALLFQAKVILDDRGAIITEMCDENGKLRAGVRLLNELVDQIRPAYDENVTLQRMVKANDEQICSLLDRVAELEGDVEFHRGMTTNLKVQFNEYRRQSVASDQALMATIEELQRKLARPNNGRRKKAAAVVAAFALLATIAACDPVMADPLPSDTEIYGLDDGDTCPADPAPYVFTGAGVAI